MACFGLDEVGVMDWCFKGLGWNWVEWLLRFIAKGLRLVSSCFFILIYILLYYKEKLFKG